MTHRRVGGAGRDGDRDEQEDLPPGKAWEQFSDFLWPYGLAWVHQEVTDALYSLEEAVRNDQRPTQAEIERAERALSNAQMLLGDHFTPPLAREAHETASARQEDASRAGPATPTESPTEAVEEKTLGGRASAESSSGKTSQSAGPNSRTLSTTSRRCFATTGR
jgi:hypothetical protein